MAYKRKPLYHFKDTTEVGINKIPLKKIITVEGTNLLYIKDNNSGLTETSTIQNAIDNNNLVLIVGGGGGGIAGLVSLDRIEQVATAGQDTFSVTYEPGLIELSVNGIHLYPSDWTEDAGTTIVLDTALEVGDEILFTLYGLFEEEGTLRTDGSRDMDTGYSPTNDLSPATKEYVDNNSGSTPVGYVKTDGTIAMDAGYNPVVDLDVVTKEYVDSQAGGSGSNIVYTDVNYNALSNDLIVCASEGPALATGEIAYTITLPGVPADNTIIRFMDGSGNSQNRPVLIDRNGNAIDGIQEDLTLDVNYFDIKLVFKSTDNSWALGGK